MSGDVAPLPNDAVPWLLPHQREATSRLCALLRRWGGAVLADSTGLGKTYVALSVACVLGERASVIAPAAVRAQWVAAARRTGTSIEFSSTESLSRGQVPCDTRLAVIDEAHNFRNSQTRRYGVLARWLPKRMTLILTATPLVNRVADVVALLRLFLPDDALRAAGIASLGHLEERPALVRKAWRAVAVARDAREAGVDAGLPRRHVRSPLALPAVSPTRLSELIGLIDALETPGADEPRALLQLLLLRALASSAMALRASSQHHLRFVERVIDAARAGLTLERRSFRRLVAGGDPDQLGFLPVLLDATRLPADIDALERDRTRLREISRLCQSEDPKACALRALLVEQRVTGRTLVFVNGVVTARYLTGQLTSAVALTGSGGWTPAGRLSARDALLPFHPNGRPPPHLDAKVLVATDVAGEGLDLHGASFVIHYDLPWTPARLAQRVGRVRRLGSPHHSVDELAFLPAPSLADRLRLVTRLLGKERMGSAVNRALAATAALCADAPRARLPEQQSDALPAIVYRLQLGGYWFADGLPRAPAAARRLRTVLRAATARVKPPAAVRLARRLLVRAAARAVKERSNDLVKRVERALDRLATGLTAGELLLLEDALASPGGRLRRTTEWADRVGDRPAASPSIEVFLVTEPGQQLPSMG